MGSKENQPVPHLTIPLPLRDTEGKVNIFFLGLHKNKVTISQLDDGVIHKWEPVCDSGEEVNLKNVKDVLNYLSEQGYNMSNRKGGNVK